MPALHFGNPVVVACPHRHCELHLLALNLAHVEAGLCREYVVERCQTVSSTTRCKVDAEVFRMPVNCANQPEENLRLQQRRPITGRRVAAFEQIKKLHHAGAAIALVSARRRDRKGLTAILLRKSQQMAVRRPPPVKRSITSVVVLPKVAISARFTGRPKAAASGGGAGRP